MSLGRALGVLIVLSAGTAAAQAADYRVARAAAASDSLWLGHFTGGRNLAPGVQPIPLDWVDVKERFGSLRACSTWIAQYKRAYHTYEGYKTCVRLR